MTYPTVFHGCRFHRNGIMGAGYYAVSMVWRHGKHRYSGTAVVFEQTSDAEAPRNEGFISILDQNGDSWRYEDFAEGILAFIESRAGQAMAFGS